MATAVRPFEKLALRAVKRFEAVSRDATADFFDHALWDHARADQLGVIAWDPRGHKIGLNRREIFVPMDRYKQTIVGRMVDYNFFDGDGDEADWCMLIDPSPSYRFVLDDVVQVMTALEKVFLQKVGSKVVVECEITPDENFYNNGYFSKTDHVSQNIGKTLGLYGPWVRDGGHGGRPEIHPAEIIWWRDTAATTKLPKWTFLVVQDDSNRFDRKSDFSGTIGYPWSGAPRRAAFAVALELKSGFAHKYRLSVRRHRNMAVLRTPVATINTADYFLSGRVTPSGHGPLPPGPAQFPILTLQVEKKITRPRDLGPGDSPGAMQSSTRVIPPIPDLTSPGMLDATLSKIVADPQRAGVYRAFLTFQVQVGTTNDRGGEGYAEIVLEQFKPTKVGGVFTE